MFFLLEGEDEGCGMFFLLEGEEEDWGMFFLRTGEGPDESDRDREILTQFLKSWDPLISSNFSVTYLGVCNALSSFLTTFFFFLFSLLSSFMIF